MEADVSDEEKAFDGQLLASRDRFKHRKALKIDMKDQFVELGSSS